MYILLQEKTNWSYPNNTYIVTENKQKCIGYFKKNNTIPIMFKKSVSFDTRYRKFDIVGKIE